MPFVSISYSSTGLPPMLLISSDSDSASLLVMTVSFASLYFAVIPKPATDRIAHFARGLAVREMTYTLKHNSPVSPGEVVVESLRLLGSIAKVRCALNHQSRSRHVFNLA